MRRERDLPSAGLCAPTSSGVRFVLTEYTKLTLLGLLKPLIFTLSIISNTNCTENCVVVITASLNNLLYFILQGCDFLSTVSFLFLLGFGLTP